MGTFAQNTSVSTDKSKAEIERTLSRYGAEQFMYGWEMTRAVIQFKMNNRMIRFDLPLPDRNDKEFTITPGGRRKRTPEAAYEAWEQSIRQKWRALALVVKAKLEAVESGITTFEDEFLAHILLPDGSTVGQFMTPQIETAYSTGNMPLLLPAYDSKKD